MKEGFLRPNKAGKHPNAGWLSQGGTQMYLFSVDYIVSSISQGL